MIEALATLVITFLALLAWEFIREPLRRHAARNLSPNGLMIERLLSDGAQAWDLNSLTLTHKKSGLRLTVGYGFHRFDITDSDWIRELPLMDRFALWPRVMSLRSTLRWQSVEKAMRPVPKTCQAVRSGTRYECDACGSGWEISGISPPCGGRDKLGL